jgi:hypothetical protein
VLKSERFENWSKILALIILSFLMIGLPGLTFAFCVLTGYALYNWFLLLTSAPQGSVTTVLILSLLSTVSFCVLRKLITWLRR